MDWDKKLRIRTAGLDDRGADLHHNRYEPTDYAVLDRLADSGHIRADSILVDYGCGKGRVGFYLSHRLGCRTIGVEFDPAIYGQAMENRKTYAGRGSADFVCMRAETYPVTEEDCFYFFNPFSVELLSAVFSRILNSWYERPRSVRLFFYYPDDRCRAWLLSSAAITQIDEIDCRDLFPGNDPRERVLVFALEP